MNEGVSEKQQQCLSTEGISLLYDLAQVLPWRPWMKANVSVIIVIILHSKYYEIIFTQIRQTTRCQVDPRFHQLYVIAFLPQLALQQYLWLLHWLSQDRQCIAARYPSSSLLPNHTFCDSHKTILQQNMDLDQSVLILKRSHTELDVCIDKIDNK